MDRNRRKELKEQYKEIKTYMGVYQIKNRQNGKIYIGSFPNLKNKWLTLQSQLNMGMFANPQLQKDWKELGGDSFTYEVLEQKEIKDVSDKRWALKQMLKPWMEKLQPYGEKGYNKLPRD